MRLRTWDQAAPFVLQDAGLGLVWFEKNQNIEVYVED